MVVGLGAGIGEWERERPASLPFAAALRPPATTCVRPLPPPHPCTALQVCSYAQGYNIIRAKSQEQGWNTDLGALARIWKGGCIIRAGGCCLAGAGLGETTGGMAKVLGMTAWNGKQPAQPLRSTPARSAPPQPLYHLSHASHTPPPAPSPPPGFLDRIKQAFQRNTELPNLLVDPEFAKDLADR